MCILERITSSNEIKSANHFRKDVYSFENWRVGKECSDGKIKHKIAADKIDIHRLSGLYGD